MVALGGNAIQSPGGDDSVAGDFTRTKQTAERLVAFALAGPRRVVITHGNGPQVGNHLYRSELGRLHGGLAVLPLDVCVADTQGGMGYMLQQCLTNAFEEAGVPAVVASVVTQVVVEASDPAFKAPSKPVGELLTEEGASEARARGWAVEEDRHRGGWRRVVPSPDPKEIVEAAAIQVLVNGGVVVVAAGGGGVPVVQRPHGALEGSAAVVDKDLASALLACDLAADSFVALTDVEAVQLDHGTPEARAIASLTVAEARAHLDAGQFPPGSMGPKVEALCRFVEATGRPARIASIEQAERALDDSIGTEVTP